MIEQIKREITEIGDRDLLTEKIIGCCFMVHRELGPGFNERIYHNSLKIAFNEAGLKYESEKEFVVKFKDKNVGTFRLDLLIENKVVVEIKSLAGNIPDVFKYQILSYLKAANLKVGLLVNFGNKSCQIKRFML